MPNDRTILGETFSLDTFLNNLEDTIENPDVAHEDMSQYDELLDKVEKEIRDAISYRCQASQFRQRDLRISGIHAIGPE